MENGMHMGFVCGSVKIKIGWSGLKEKGWEQYGISVQYTNLFAID